MLSLDQFKEYYEPITQYNEEFDKNVKAVKLMFPSSYTVPELGTHLLDNYISLLSKMMNDTDEFISYYVFDCEDGKKPMSVEIPNGEGTIEILLDSVDQLYNLIVWENEDV